MKNVISKIAGSIAVIGAILIVISQFFSEIGYIFFWIGIVVLVMGGIVYFSTGEKIKDWFWNIFNWI